MRRNPAASDAAERDRLLQGALVARVGAQRDGERGLDLLALLKDLAGLLGELEGDRDLALAERAAHAAERRAAALRGELDLAGRAEREVDGDRLARAGDLRAAD